MNNNEMFDSAVRSKGDLAGVFEYDGETGYFYLYNTLTAENQKIIATVHIVNGKPDFNENEVAIFWNCIENSVGLFIREKLWAVFDCNTGAKYGGNYHVGAQPQIPKEIAETFVTIAG